MFTDKINIMKQIDKLNGFEFEEFLYWLFKKLGYDVELTTKSGDKGVDLILNNKIAIQVKRNGVKSVVGNKAVQEIVAGKTYYGCEEGWVITTSFYTKQAIDLADKNNIKLYDRDDLNELFFKNGFNQLEDILTSFKFNRITKIPTPVKKTIFKSAPKDKDKELSPMQMERVLLLKEDIKYIICTDGEVKIRKLSKILKTGYHLVIAAMRILREEKWVDKSSIQTEGYTSIATKQMKTDFMKNWG